MQSIEKRITALEQAKPKQDMVIFVTAVEVGKLDEELTFVSDGAGNEWTRQPHESEGEFKERAKTELTRNESGVAMLYNFPMEVH